MGSKTTAGTTMSDNFTSETNPFKSEFRQKTTKLIGGDIIVVDLDAVSNKSNDGDVEVLE